MMFDFASFPKHVPVVEARTYNGQELHRMTAFETFYQRQTQETIKQQQQQHHLTSPFVPYRLHPKDSIHPLPYNEFVELFQCSPDQPELDQGMALSRLIPATKDIIEMLAAEMESACPTWQQCREKVNECKQHKYNPNAYFGSEHAFTGHKLFRNINNTLYTDWPWGTERISTQIAPQFLIHEVLRVVGDFKDSVFFGSGEIMSTFPWNHPFVFFSNAPSITNNEIPFIWPEAIRKQYEHYIAARKHKQTYTEIIDEQNNLFPWKQRDNRAALFSNIDEHRLIVLELERQFPALIYTQGLCERLSEYFSFHSFNPSDSDNATETMALFNNNNNRSNNSNNNTSKKIPAGFKLGLLQFCFDKQQQEEASMKERNFDHIKQLHPYPHAFKYVVVPLGASAVSTSGRLAELMAISGAVVLIQTGTMSYHFSKRLIPWIHFVPLNYNLADLAEKVTWLQQHDDLAQQLARNARTFADSYLRLEDDFCYYAKALHDLGELQEGSDALIPFNPVLLPPPK